MIPNWTRGVTSRAAITTVVAVGGSDRSSRGQDLLSIIGGD